METWERGTRPHKMGKNTESNSRKWTNMLHCEYLEGCKWNQGEKSRFSAYEVAVLSQNPYTHEVRQAQISFTSEFKKIFLARYQAGEYIPEIFDSLGCDPNMLGMG